MYCKSCGKEITDGTRFCPDCGFDQSSGIKPRNPNESDRSRLVACLLAFFLGGLGVHRFYVGKVGSGICQILLTCCFGIGCLWAFIDFVLIVCGTFKDSEGKVVSNFWLIIPL